jgi:hypothetical protein
MSQQKLEAIASLLNQLIQSQPELARVFDCGIKANDAVTQMTDIYCRPYPDGDYVTMTGVISAIGQIVGADDEWTIVSSYQENQLTGFIVIPHPKKP